MASETHSQFARASLTSSGTSSTLEGSGSEPTAGTGSGTAGFCVEGATEGDDVGMILDALAIRFWGGLKSVGSNDSWRFEES